MIRVTRILCPVDFSEFSRRALDHAAAIAGWYGARLTVLHVIPNPIAYDLPPVEVSEKDFLRIASEMKRFTEHVPADVAIEHGIEVASDVHSAILERAQQLKADLLVLGSHGRSGFERLLLGSVTEKLLRKASCPALVVPRRAADVAPDQPVRFGRILCAIDFSDESLRALEYALDMAEEEDARLMVLHAIEVPPELTGFPVSAAFSVDEVRAAAEAEALRRIRMLIPEEARTYCSIETIVREGAPHREILKLAAERRPDLIVMGVQGRGALDRLLFGSNTARVTRAAECPVLAVRPAAVGRAAAEPGALAGLET